MSALTYIDLRLVNSKVNLLPYTTDPAKYGLVEFWEAAEADGDCEDMALAKLQRLKHMGLPIAQMRIITCFARPYATREEKAKRGHAALAVELVPGGKTYILDIGNDLPIDADLYPHELHKIQIPGTREFDYAKDADRTFL